MEDIIIHIEAGDYPLPYIERMVRPLREDVVNGLIDKIKDLSIENNLHLQEVKLNRKHFTEMENKINEQTEELKRKNEVIDVQIRTIQSQNEKLKPEMLQY